MKGKKSSYLGLGLVLALVYMTPILAFSSEENTTLQINEVRGGLAGVTVEIENTGDYVATELAVITTIQGGLLNAIDITHNCSGCSVCGSSLDPGAIKTENSREAGALIGIGPIQITTIAYAANAQQVSSECSGFVIGPFVLIN